ncbi:YwmB family TATA-box binding protein [Paenibacillus sp. TAB 01]|uniref:YwmB family TATA-box binding protein n=1 Tax=Paenibacillus sp. TAB 01 TaxID=3368988 RepID=UPI003752B97C
MTAQTEEGHSGPAAQQAMTRLQHELSGTLQSLGLAPQWNVMIQGTLSDTFADMTEDPLSVYHWLSEELQLKEVGKYQDTGSTSISYYSPLLPAITPDPSAPASRMNFQVAVHRNSMTREQRLTIATPAISIEY